MQFDVFDKKVKEAADNHHPPYDDNAWAGMVKLLDEHMPEEKNKKRRIIFFLFLFLLLGGGGFWFLSGMPGIGNKKQAKTNIKTQQQNGTLSASGSDNLDKISANNDKIKNEEISRINITVDSKTNTNPVANEPKTFDLTLSNKNSGQKNIYAGTDLNKKRNNPDRAMQKLNNDPGLENRNKINNDPNSKQVPIPSINSIATVNSPDKKNNPIEILADNSQNTIAPESKSVLNDQPEKEKESVAKITPKKKTKTKGIKGNNFFFSLSAGPDLSFTGNDKLGKTKLLAGVGVGYTIKDRFTIRSGFYSGRKVYTASPESYHPPTVFWNYYPNMEKIDADCKVYEIPLTLSYHFGNSPKQNWFASAGLSSFLMKKETYNYHYKYNPTGPTVQKAWTIENENKHYFSVLTLSGGYQKNISKSFTLMAEPYIKIPLAGVGYGKVKLNSGGLLISVGYKPFVNSGNKLKSKN